MIVVVAVIVKCIVIVKFIVQTNGFITQHEIQIDQFILISTTRDFVVVILIVSIMIVVVVIVISIIIPIMIVIFINDHGIVPILFSRILTTRLVVVVTIIITTTTNEIIFFQYFIFFQSFRTNHIFQLKICILME